jgi:hypothetical protein
MRARARRCSRPGPGAGNQVAQTSVSVVAGWLVQGQLPAAGPRVTSRRDTRSCLISRGLGIGRSSVGLALGSKIAGQPSVIASTQAATGHDAPGLELAYTRRPTHVNLTSHSEPHPIDERVDGANEQLGYGLGYDHNFVLDPAPAGHALRPLAGSGSLWRPSTFQTRPASPGSPRPCSGGQVYQSATVYRFSVTG